MPLGAGRWLHFGQSARVSRVRDSFALGAAILAAVLVSGFLLAGCSPDDISGVRLSDQGAPVLVNCGTYFRSVKAYDASSGRLLWSAGKPKQSSDSGVAEVELGVLPDKDWVEDSPLKMNTSPTAWRFIVSRSGYSDPTTWEVAASDLSADQVFVLGTGERVSPEHFRGKTCGYDPPVPSLVTRVVLIVLVVGAVALTTSTVYRSRRRTRTLR